MGEENFRDELLRKVFTQYPVFYRGLEVGCGDGQRIRVGRGRGLNLYGCDIKDFKNAWAIQGIDPYVRKVNLHSLPYKDEMFDFVSYPKAFKPSKKVFKELYRVGSRNYYLKLDTKRNMGFWAKVLAEVGFRLEVMNVSTDGHLVVEARKG